MSRNDTWMPLYLGDYLADTMHLNGAQHGAYLLLLMHYWRNGPLPDDDAQLAVIAKTESKAWRGMARVIRAFFTAHGGRLHQKRMDAERARADSISNGRSEAGKRGAESRWGGGKPPDKPGGKPIANAMANAWQQHRQIDAPLQSHKKDKILPDSELARAEPPPDPPVGPEAARNVVVSLRKAMRPTAYAPGWKSLRSPTEQIEAVTKPPARARHLTPEQLALVRKKAAAQ